MRDFLITVAIIYSFASAAVALNNIIDADNAFGPCNRKPKRWEMLLPAYRLGCWLGEEVE